MKKSARQLEVTLSPPRLHIDTDKLSTTRNQQRHRLYLKQANSSLCHSLKRSATPRLPLSAASHCSPINQSCPLVLIPDSFCRPPPTHRCRA